ncbi:hypothetical protein HDE_01052 [Halotydeus destructor]|nr:hypothetical protein HDE_01052 [Halotydeus destructor]
MVKSQGRALAIEAIGPIDYLLMVFGNRLFTDTLLARTLNKLFAVILILVTVLYCRWVIGDLPGVKFFQALRWLVIPTATTVIHLVIACRRVAVCNLLAKVCQHLTDEDMKKARKYAMLLCLTIVAVVATSFALELLEYLHDEDLYYWYNATLFGDVVNGYKWYHKAMAIVVWLVYTSQIMQQWIGFTVVFYVHTYYLFYLRHESLTRTMKRSKDDEDHLFYVTMTENLSTYNRLKQDLLNDKLSIFPFMWFASLFTSLAGLVQHATTDQSLDLNILRSVAFATEAIFVMGALLYVDGRENRLQAEMDKFRLKVLQRPRTDLAIFSATWSLVKTMEDKVQLTAWSCFDLNRSLILSFVSAIISFTVMFHQLNSGT